MQQDVVRIHHVVAEVRIVLISPLLEVNDSRLVSTVDSVLQHGGQFVKHIKVLAQSLAFSPLVDVLTLV